MFRAKLFRALCRAVARTRPGWRRLWDRYLIGPNGNPVAAGPPVSLAFFMASAANSYAQAQLEGVEEVAAA